MLSYSTLTNKPFLLKNLYYNLPQEKNFLQEYYLHSFSNHMLSYGELEVLFRQYITKRKTTSSDNTIVINFSEPLPYKILDSGVNELLDKDFYIDCLGCLLCKIKFNSFTGLFYHMKVDHHNLYDFFHCRYRYHISVSEKKFRDEIHVFMIRKEVNMQVKEKNVKIIYKDDNFSFQRDSNEIENVIMNVILNSDCRFSYLDQAAQNSIYSSNSYNNIYNDQVYNSARVKKSNEDLNNNNNNDNSSFSKKLLNSTMIDDKEDEEIEEDENEEIEEIEEDENENEENEFENEEEGNSDNSNSENSMIDENKINYRNNNLNNISSSRNNSKIVNVLLNDYIKRSNENKNKMEVDDEGSLNEKENVNDKEGNDEDDGNQEDNEAMSDDDEFLDEMMSSEGK